jgi:hypothetical protein
VDSFLFTIAVETSSFKYLTSSFVGINFDGVVYQPPPRRGAGEKEHLIGKVKIIRKAKKHNNNSKTQFRHINKRFIALFSLLNRKTPAIRWGFIFAIKKTYLKVGFTFGSLNPSRSRI